MSATRPETGATKAQIEEAKQNMASRFGTIGGKASSSVYVDLTAPYLVPPGSVIALAEHVVSAADREAIGRAERIAKTARDVVRNADLWNRDAQAIEVTAWALVLLAEEIAQFTDEHLARLERLGSGGEETT